MRELSGKRVTVMGLGQFGGGLGVTKWLWTHGARVTLTDSATEDKLSEPLAELRASQRPTDELTLAFGGHRESDFTDTDLVVANPAVRTPWSDRYIRLAREAGVPVTSEIVLTCERIPSKSSGVKVVGITGSVGKSTTSSMIAHAVKAVVPGRVVFGGNIGGSILGEVESLRAGDVLVLELSSAMLHWLEPIGFAPDVAVVTNLSANHLDWHGELEHYRRSKQNLLRFQKPGATAVLGTGEVAEWATEPGVHRRMIPTDAGVDGLLVPGKHNCWNAAVAAAAVGALGLVPTGDPRIVASLRTFPGLEHRLRRVGVTSGGVVAYNDSKSTTPESALTAIEAFAEEPGLGRVHLIAGGYDKGADLSAVGRLGTRLAGLYTVGKTGPTIAAASRGAAVECETLDRAVEAALSRGKAGDVLLLSPACASWGQYQNFERRGEHFVELLRARGLEEAV